MVKYCRQSGPSKCPASQPLTHTSMAGPSSPAHLRDSESLDFRESLTLSKDTTDRFSRLADFRSWLLEAWFSNRKRISAGGTEAPGTGTVAD